MNITPVHCPDSSCPWAAFGIPSKYTEARDWHLAVHRAEEHGEPLTAEQIAYATRVGHVIPGTARTTADAVAVMAALPVPVGDQPQPLDDQRLAEIAERTPERAAALTAWLNQFAPVDGQRALENAETVLAEDVPALLADNARLRAEVAELKEQRERRRLRLIALQNDALSMRGSLAPNGEDRKVPFELGETLTPAVDWLITRVAELEAERHSTNEVLSDAAEALREMRDQLAKYELPTAEDMPGMRHAIRTINPTAEEASR